ncbi:MAG: hypothetical protein R2788_12645 [Saprospiraceae bacterium]
MRDSSACHKKCCLEILITVMVVILMLFNLKSSLLVSYAAAVAVLMCFIAMRHFGVDANIVALSGIAIAITLWWTWGSCSRKAWCTSIDNALPDEDLFTSIYEATTEVASAVITAVATTVISFLPVFTMEASEGKTVQAAGIYQNSCVGVYVSLWPLPSFPPLRILFLKEKIPLLVWCENIVGYIGNALLLIGGIVTGWLFNGLLGAFWS